MMLQHCLDHKLEMARDDMSLLVIASGIPSQPQSLLECHHQVNRCTGRHECSYHISGDSGYGQQGIGGRLWTSVSSAETNAIGDCLQQSHEMVQRQEKCKGRQ